MHNHGHELVPRPTGVVDGDVEGGADAGDFGYGEVFGEEDAGVHLWSGGWW